MSLLRPLVLVRILEDKWDTELRNPHGSETGWISEREAHCCKLSQWSDVCKESEQCSLAAPVMLTLIKQELEP